MAELKMRWMSNKKEEECGGGGAPGCPFMMEEEEEGEEEADENRKSLDEGATGLRRKTLWTRCGGAR